MPYRDGTTDGLDALRKHREKRRAKAVLSMSSNKQYTNRSQFFHPDSDGGTANESPSFRTEGSSQDVPTITAEEESSNDKNISSNEFFKTIVTTTLDREKMRKISMLGFDDPADTVSRRRENSKGDNGLIIATEESIETMRKISMLGLEDPVDRAPDSPARRGLKQRRAAGPGKTIHVQRHRDSARYAGVELSELREMSRGAFRAAPCTSHLLGASACFPSIDPNPALGGSSRSPAKRERKARRRSLDLDYPAVFGLTEGVSFPPIQVTTTEDESVPKDRSRCPIVFGVVEAPEEKWQLMRMVSVLGMQDPVFGNIEESTEAGQEPTVDEDMDGVEGPADTKEYTVHSLHLQVASAGFPAIDPNSPLGCSSRSPVKRERKARRRSLDLDYPVAFGLTEGVSFPPIQVTTTDDESVTRDRSRCPIVFGVVEAPEEKWQLMRMVSVLGMQDPIFGNIEESTGAGQEPTVDEEMDGVEGPADTKEYTAHSSHLQVASAGFPAIDPNSPLGCSSRSPVKRERKARRRSLDLDYPVVFRLTEGVSFPPIQVTTTEDESVTRDCSRCPIVFGVVEATEEKQQVMRMVSVLGMHDPVFDSIQEDMEDFHDPVVDETMGGVEVTTNTIGHVADVTEVTDTGKTHLHLAPESECHEVGFEQGSRVEVYEPPGGTFNRRASQKNVHGVIPVVISLSPPVPKGRKSVSGGPSQRPQNDPEDAPPAGRFLRRVSAWPDTGISPPAVTPSPPMPKGRKSVTKGLLHRLEKDMEDGGCVPPSEGYAFGRRASVKSDHPALPPDFSASPSPTTSRKCTGSGSSQQLEKDNDELMSSSNRHSSTGFVSRYGAFDARKANERSSTPILEASLTDFEMVDMVPDVPPSPPSTSSKRSATSGSLRQLDKDNDELMNSSSRHSVKDFVPPNGAFNVRKPNERSSTPTRDMLLKDMELAHMVQSIFHDDTLLAESACSLHQSMSELNASFGCINFDGHENI